MSRSELVDIECEIRMERSNAIAVYTGETAKEGPYKGGDKLYWLPRSQIEIEARPPGKRTATVTMPRWLAEEKGLV